LKATLAVAAALLAVALPAGAQSPPVPSAAAKAQLAPNGKLRFAFTVSNPNYATQPAGEKLSGIGIDIGEALAKRLGVPLEVVRYTATAENVADAKSGKWDVAILGIEASRKASMDFTSPYAVTKNSYVVPAGSALKTIPDVDRKGVKVAVSANTAQHVYLKDALKSAALVPVANNLASTEELKAGRVDAVAANQNTLEAIVERMPGYRVIPGSYSDVQYSLAVPKGREAGAAFLDAFVKHLRSSGAIQKSLDQHKLKGVTVP
jgi:polar amino acid transport system substrate-binding protein